MTHLPPSSQFIKVVEKGVVPMGGVGDGRIAREASGRRYVVLEDPEVATLEKDKQTLIQSRYLRRDRYSQEEERYEVQSNAETQRVHHLMVIGSKV